MLKNILFIAGEDILLTQEKWDDSQADSVDSIYAYNAIQGQV